MCSLSMVALLKYVERKALHHCSNYCTISFNLLNQQINLTQDSHPQLPEDKGVWNTVEHWEAKTEMFLIIII